MMRMIISASCLASMGLLVLFSTPVLPQQLPLCRDPNDPRAQKMVDYFKNILTDPNEVEEGYVEEMGIAGVSPSNVAIFHSELYCRRAIVNVISYLESENLLFSGRQVWVVRIGYQRLAVHDPEHIAGEWSPLIVYDLGYHIKSVVLNF